MRIGSIAKYNYVKKEEFTILPFVSLFLPFSIVGTQLHIYLRRELEAHVVLRVYKARKIDMHTYEHYTCISYGII